MESKQAFEAFKRSHGRYSKLSPSLPSQRAELAALRIGWDAAWHKQEQQAVETPEKSKP